MFLEYYKMERQPFGVTPDPRFLYFGATHREAFASLLYAIESKRGFSALVAEPGMGKTSLLAHLLETLGNTARTAYLFQTDGDSRDLLRGLLSDLGIDISANNDVVAMHSALNKALYEEERAGKPVIVILDEAQNLDEQSLESVRLLSNFETSTQKLMHIALAGQPGLAMRLEEPRLEQLRQRVSSIIRLEHFTREETVEFIGHRLVTAGYRGAPIFTPEALDIIARVSQGIPRNINNICFQALSIGFATQTRKIGAEVLREVVADFEHVPKHNHEPSKHPTGAPQRTLPQTPPANFPAVFTSLPRSWEMTSETRERSLLKFGFVAIACVAVPLLAAFALSDPKLGFNETNLGRVSDSMVNAVLSSGDPNSDFMPPWPAKLKAPPAPTVETTSQELLQSALAQGQTPDENQPDEDETDGPARKQSVVAIPKSMTLREIATAFLGESSREAIGEIRALNPQVRFENRSVPKGTQIALPSDSSKDTSASQQAKIAGNGRPGTERVSPQPDPDRYQRPITVQVLRRETLFQFALEHYGSASWTIVEDICRENPSLHGAYDILSPGQRIRLPEDSTKPLNSSSPVQFSR